MRAIIYTILLELIYLTQCAIVLNSGHEWQTYDENLIENEWMLFPDGDGNIFNVSLRNKDAVSFEVQNKDVSFWLYTRNNRYDPQKLSVDDVEGLRNSKFNKYLNSKFIIHGWRNNKKSYINKLLVNAFLDNYSVNVIVVDWGPIARRMNYYAVRNKVKAVGEQVSYFIMFLKKACKISLAKIHIVGHSLGAHVAGYAGSHISGGSIMAITGLDPALPLFSIKDPKNRLNETDVTYVEVIHTDGGRLGFALPLGDVDFYPNKGGRQPGCGLDIAGVCAHLRSIEYFEESLRNDDGFYAKPCISYDEVKKGNCSADGTDLRMGGKYPKLGYRGTYLLQTRSSVPYGLIDYA